jgi:addiction module HigA family antidote
MSRAMKYRPPVHPGRILKEDLLDPLELSVNQLARALRVPANRLSQIVRGVRAVTPDTSLRLGRYFGFSPDFWLRLQMHYEFELARRMSLARIEREVRPRRVA